MAGKRVGGGAPKIAVGREVRAGIRLGKGIILFFFSLSSLPPLPPSPSPRCWPFKDPEMESPHLELLESPEGCPSPLELRSAPSKKMWVKLRAL